MLTKEEIEREVKEGKALFTEADAQLAAQTWRDVASDDSAPPAARNTAADFLAQRVLGKVPDKMENTTVIRLDLGAPIPVSTQEPTVPVVSPPITE